MVVHIYSRSGGPALPSSNGTPVAATIVRISDDYITAEYIDPRNGTLKTDRFLRSTYRFYAAADAA